MSGRTTAEIVAELRGSAECVVNPPCDKCQRHIEAADRLTELDADVASDAAEILHYGKTLTALDALRLPCPTCGGEGEFTPMAGSMHDESCPDCTDGRMGHERAWKIVAAVFEGDDVLRRNVIISIDDLLTHLRGTR